MTKQVIGLDGNEATVANDTPCHAGKNGSLPRLYTVEELVVIDTAQAIAKTEMDNAKPVRDAHREIARLEAKITPRRLRMAIAGTEETEGWLAAQEALIATQRSKLTGGETSDYEPEGITSL